MEEFKNKKILITGGAHGIGLELVKSFANICSEVIFIDKDKVKGKKIQNYPNSKKNIYFYYCDLSNFKNSMSIFRKVLKKHKNINFLINNAKSGKRYEVLKESEKNWDQSMNVILKNSFFFSQEFIKNNNNKKTFTSILNISSIVTKMVSKESPSYHAAKSGLEGITKYLAAHAGKYNVRINAILPGFIIQKRHHKKFFSKRNSKYRNSVFDLHPMRNVGTEDDIIKVAIFLLSSNSKFVNGSCIDLDGALSKNNYLKLQEQLK